MESIAGVDEAGRGPLAGPVVAAACVFDNGYTHKEITDSKKLSKKKRELLFEGIKNDAKAWAIAVIGPELIDEINILEATKCAMETVLSLVEADRGLIDGNFTVPSLFPVEAVIKGDSKHIEISAASILAKVHRDRIMEELDHLYPQYGFKGHAGYPTKAHKAAIQEFGPSPVHRSSFKGVKEFVTDLSAFRKTRSSFDSHAVLVSCKSN